MHFSYPIQTKYHETAQDKIIHHSSYVIYLEVARIQFFQEIGCDINELEKKEIYCPVLELSLKYQKKLFSLQDIVVEVSIQAFSKVRFFLSYKIFHQKICVFTGSSQHCFVNASFNPIPIPEEILKKFQEFAIVEDNSQTTLK